MYTNVPAPLPDECLRGYGFRVNASNAKDLLNANQLLPELSEASGLSISHLVTNNCYLAYTRFAHSTYGYLDIRTHPDLMSNRNISNGKTPIRTARYCPECINRDIYLHGISYWHRIHQLPGINHCIKHNVSLVDTNSHNGYSCQPLTSSKLKSTIPSDRLIPYFKSEHIKKFSYLSAEILKMGLSFEYFVIRNALISRYQKLVQNPCFNLSKLVREKYPKFWLNQIFYGIDFNKNSHNSEKLFEAFKNHSYIKPVMVYLMLMTLFWNDPREAMRECLSKYYSRPLEDGRVYFMPNKYDLFRQSGGNFLQKTREF